MRGLRYATALSILVTFLSGLGFLYLYLARAELYAFTEVEPAALGNLYPVSQNAMAIGGFETGDGPVLIPHLVNAEDCTSWKLRRDGGEPQILKGRAPAIPVRPGSFDYTLAPQDCAITEPAVDVIRLNVFFGSAEGFGAQNLFTDQFQINRSNLPILMAEPVPFSTWIPDAEIPSHAEAEEARDMLREAGFPFDAKTRDKIAFLTQLVLQSLPDGSPPPYLNTISPWSVFKAKHSGGTGNFCRQYALTYGYLANLAGIPTRNLFTGGAIANVDMGSHALSESYIVEEARWAMVDPTNAIAYVTAPNGEVMNAAEIYTASIAGNLNGLTAVSVSDANTKTVPFDEVSTDLRAFMHKDNFIIYIGSLDGLYQMQGDGVMKYARKLYRFLFQPKQYYGYTSFVSYHWLRPLSFALMTAFGTMSVLLLAILYRNRRQVS